MLDEIEYCSGSAETLAGLADREIADIIVTGSCITSGNSGFGNDPEPWEERLEIRPMRFPEFLAEMGIDGDVIGEVSESLTSNSRIDRRSDALMSEMFGRFMVTGGLPESVAALSATDRLADSLSISRRNLELQLADAYMLKRGIYDIIRNCMMSLPVQLADNGRFTYSKVDGRVSMNRRYYIDSIGWLAASGMVTVCRRMDDGDADGELPRNYKLYTDPGTLACMMDSWVSDAMTSGHYERCPCAVVENCIANMLSAEGLRIGYYSTDRHEADFVVGSGKDVVGIAVRSRNNRRRKSLTTLKDSGIITRGIEFGRTSRPSMDENYPLYAAGFIRDIL